MTPNSAVRVLDQVLTPKMVSILMAISSRGLGTIRLEKETENVIGAVAPTVSSLHRKGLVEVVSSLVQLTDEGRALVNDANFKCVATLFQRQ